MAQVGSPDSKKGQFYNELAGSAGVTHTDPISNGWVKNISSAGSAGFTHQALV